MNTTPLRKRRTAIVAILFGLGLATGAAIGAGVWHQNSTANANVQVQPQTSETNLNDIPLVKVVSIDALDRPTSQLAFTARVVGRYQSPLAFRVAGKISARHVEVGQRVKKGDLLAEIEADDFELQLATSQANEEAAKAAVLQAQQEEKRIGQLLRERAISQSDYDSVKLLLDSSQARLVAASKQTELARRQLSYVKLYADSNAVAVAIQAEAGQVVSAGQQIVTLVQSDELELEVDLPEQFASLRGVEYGQVSFWTHPDKVFMVRLRELSPIADSDARTFRACYSFVDAVKQPERDSDSWSIQGIPFKLGMTANLIIGEGTQENLVAIPATSIGYENNQSIVWSLTISTDANDPNVHGLEAVPVQIEKIDDSSVFVSIDLLRGRTIVAAGVQKLNRKSVVRKWTK